MSGTLRGAVMTNDFFRWSPRTPTTGYFLATLRVAVFFLPTCKRVGYAKSFKLGHPRGILRVISSCLSFRVKMCGLRGATDSYLCSVGSPTVVAGDFNL